MFLHNDKELFKDIITETASSLGIDPSIIAMILSARFIRRK